jgi:hypothetical protein
VNFNNPKLVHCGLVLRPHAWAKQQVQNQKPITRFDLLSLVNFNNPNFIVGFVLRPMPGQNSEKQTHGTV